MAEISSPLEEFSEILKDKPGATDLAQHDIKTTAPQPVRVRPHPLPFATRRTVEISKRYGGARNFEVPRLEARIKEGFNTL